VISAKTGVTAKIGKIQLPFGFFTAKRLGLRHTGPKRIQTLSFFNELKRRNVLRVGAAYVVTAWLVIQVVDTILPAFGFGDVAVRFVTIAFTIGLLPVLILSWAFELTPDGLKKDSEAHGLDSYSPQAGKKLDRIIMVVLALALGYFAFDQFVLDPQKDAALQLQQSAELQQVAKEARQEGRSQALTESYGDKSIAVLAFKDMSTNKDQEYLSDGIAEELLNLLSKIPELRVISRSSAFSFKGRDIKLTDIAKELNVAHILEGSVRKAGNKVRITAQLIDARSDTHIWSETYDRTLDDIFAVQDDIAGVVTDQLKVSLLGDEAAKAREIDPVAFELLLESRHVRRKATSEAYHRSNELADAALKIEPQLARAWVIKSYNFSNMASSGELPRDEAYELAREAAENAQASNPESAGAYSALAWVEMYYDNDLVLAARQFERALQLDGTNLRVLSNAAALLLKLRRFDSAIAIQEFGVERSPLSTIAFYNLGETYFAAGRFDESVVAFQTALELSPGYRGGYLWLAKALMLSGKSNEALTAARKEKFEPFRQLAVALCAFGAGEQLEADAALKWIVDNGGPYFPYDIASVFAYRNDHEQAAEWVGKTITMNDTDVGDPAMDPLFTNISDSPKWKTLMKALGKSPSQLDSIQFDVTLPR
jgi:adenylate cyclase